MKWPRFLAALILGLAYVGLGIFLKEYGVPLVDPREYHDYTIETNTGVVIFTIILEVCTVGLFWEWFTKPFRKSSKK